MYYVYKLTVGGQPYFGFTSRSPKERLKEHIDTAYANKWKHNSKLYPMLVEMDYDYEFEVLHEYETELEALLREITEIHNYGQKVSLNNSKGGEGSTINVRSRVQDGTLQFKVTKKRRKKAKPSKKSVGRRRRSSSRKRQNRRRL